MMLQPPDVAAAVRSARFYEGTGVLVSDGPAGMLIVLDLEDGRWRLYVADKGFGIISPVTFLRSLPAEDLVVAIEDASLAIFARLQAARAAWN